MNDQECLDRIINAAQFYFCSNPTNATFLVYLFNKAGYHDKALEFNDWIEGRIEMLNRQLANVQKPAYSELAKSISGIFFGNVAEAEIFISKIEHMRDKEITDLVNQYIRQRKINDARCRIDLWKPLHDAGKYHATIDNWRKQVR